LPFPKKEEVVLHPEREHVRQEELYVWFLREKNIVHE
jgi:hypothetical protein